MEDVKEECEKYGPVLGIKIPRPTMGSRQSSGVGKIFVKFNNSESAQKALAALAGRKFADRTVVTTYFSEVKHFLPNLITYTNSTRKTSRSMPGNTLNRQSEAIRVRQSYKTAEAKSKGYQEIGTTQGFL